MIVLMANKYTLTRPSHAMLLIVLFQSLQPRKDRGVFFGLGFLGAKGVIAKRVQADAWGWLEENALGRTGLCQINDQYRSMELEGLSNIRVGSLQGSSCDGRHGSAGSVTRRYYC